MANISTVSPASGEAVHVHVDAAVHQAYQLLHIAFIVAPIVAGADKFMHVLVNWGQYLAPQVAAMLPMAPERFMFLVGIVEIVAGLVVAFSPVIGGYLVAVWLWGIIANLLMIPGYFDIALRDFGLSLAALALARLGQEFSVK